MGLRLASAWLGVAGLLAACGGGDTPSADAAGAEGPGVPSVVVTTSILGDVVTRVAGDAADVDVLMPAGVDPHAFAPSAAQAARVREADLVVANGLGLEDQLGDVLTAAAADGTRVLEVAEQLDPLPYALSGAPHGDGDEHADGRRGEDDQGDLDPHVWFDPVRMADGARLIAAALAEVDASRDDAAWLDRGEAYAREILAVHAELEQAFAAIPEDGRVLVTNHDNLGYLAARYGFEVVGVVAGTSTLSSASAADIAELVDVVRRRDVPAVFAETTASTQLAETLAAEVGAQVEVVTLFTDALSEPGAGAGTYLELLRSNAALITAALT